MSMDWSTHFPAYIDASASPHTPPTMTKRVEIADVGCGFGGLLAALGPILPDKLMIGMELRTQVLDYVTSRITALRSQQQLLLQQSTQPIASQTLGYGNISALRTNSMKFLPNFFARGQLTHIFLAFPDPHFKARKHKARIVSRQLNAEYAFVMREGGCLYVCTDVEELFGWCVAHFEGKGPEIMEGEEREEVKGVGDVKREDEEEEEAKEGGVRAGAIISRKEVENSGDRKAKEESKGKHLSRRGGLVGVEELWERVSDEEVYGKAGEVGQCVKIMMDETEEGKKVTRNGGTKFVGVWRRKADPLWPELS